MYGLVKGDKRTAKERSRLEHSHQMHCSCPFQSKNGKRPLGTQSRRHKLMKVDRKTGFELHSD